MVGGDGSRSVRRHLEIDEAWAAAVDDSVGPGTPLDRRQHVASRLRAVPQIDRFDGEEQGAIERPLDEGLGSDAPSLGDVRLGVGAFTLTDRQQSGNDGDDEQDGESGEQALEPAVVRR